MSTRRILITGSEGLIGQALGARLVRRGEDTRCIDLRSRDPASRGDLRDPRTIAEAVDGIDGVIHLAAVARVGEAERDPEQCLQTNVIALRRLLQAMAASRRNPWLLFASSREVYGHPGAFPVTEDSPLRPVNVYGHSKAEGERLVEQASRAGVGAAIVRLPNVFGGQADHADRVVPTFTRRALANATLRVEGANNAFDFVFIDDAVEGLVRVTDVLLLGRRALPPIHLVSGASTTLAELAAMVVRLTRSSSHIEIAPPRSFDVSRFSGDPARARQLLGWRAEVPLEDGLSRFIAAHRRSSAPSSWPSQELVQ